MKFIMLVGLPGAGKSTFSTLFKTCPLKVNVLNQDTDGRKKCENEILASIKKYDITILDRTNINKVDRKKWLDLTLLPPDECLCIHLLMDINECILRANARKDHPTIKGNSERIIGCVRAKFEEPTVDEGFSQVIKLYSEEDVRTYLKTWHCTETMLDNDDTTYIHKFPRTRHIFNMGSATADDKLLTKNEYDAILREEVSITEKVDGAQLGFSIDENFTIKVQNRSHYITSKYHEQFKKLDKWIMDHPDLYEILDSDTILFGEWLYAKHSVSYTHLPDYFIAFDLYSKSQKKFYSRDIMMQKLQDTHIVPVREMYRGRIESRRQLEQMIQQQSEYTDERVEGIYIKTFEDDFVKDRCKLVRADFICGNEHWGKRKIEVNQLKY